MYISNSFVISLQFIKKTKSSETMLESNDVHWSNMGQDTEEYMKMFEGLDGGVWYSLFIKNLVHYSSH